MIVAKAPTDIDSVEIKKLRASKKSKLNLTKFSSFFPYYVSISVEY